MPRRVYSQDSQPGPETDVLLDVDFTESTDDKTGNCTYMKGKTNIKYDSYKSSRGINVSLSSRFYASLVYDMSSVINEFINANKIEFSFTFYPTSYPQQSDANNNYQTFAISTKSNGVDVQFTTNVSTSQYHGWGMNYSGDNQNISGINRENTIVLTLEKLSNTWEQGFDWTTKTDYATMQNTITTVNWKFNTGKLYICFPVKYWAGPQNYYGYVKSMKIVAY